MWFKKMVVLGMIVALSGCVSLQSVSLTQIPKSRSKVVTATADKFLFFYISFDNDFVDEVTRQLERKCKDGKVTGILTKDSVTTYFPLIFHSRVVTARGYCLKG